MVSFNFTPTDTSKEQFIIDEAQLRARLQQWLILQASCNQKWHELRHYADGIVIRCFMSDTGPLGLGSHYHEEVYQQIVTILKPVIQEQKKA